VWTRLLTCVFLLSVAYSAVAQRNRLVAGPVVGSVTPTTAKVWIAYQGKGQNAVILGDTAAKRVFYASSYSYLVSKKKIVAITFDYTGLTSGHAYNVIVSIQGCKVHARAHFTTPLDTPIHDIHFILGSCALLNTDVTRIALPGFSSDIFVNMRKRKADFMLWLGDNVYYLYPKQHSDIEHMFMRNIRVRHQFTRLRNLLMNQPNYAIWDDHDYGPDNSGKSWQLKDSSLTVFKSFWPNTYPEQSQFHGNYFTFKQYDAEFFMTDDRYYRESPSDTAAFLGETQLIWLKNKLLLSDASFKFIAIGSQVLNENNFGEGYRQYPKERTELLNFIAENNIKGVIFLSGDKHYAEFCRKDIKGYPFYDFTSSPLTSPPLTRRIMGGFGNPARLPGTDFGRRNFGDIYISGPAGDRLCTMQICGRQGKVRRSLSIRQSEIERH
jgi:alkaline phosphatase D